MALPDEKQAHSRRDQAVDLQTLRCVGDQLRHERDHVGFGVVHQTGEFGEARPPSCSNKTTNGNYNIAT